ncbi:VOC family protein [Streptomyces endophyticus]|uniref:VOC family protein n=1 Tax=Streptomyces endophyticus TaxID=714166 RepID=A0ABU6F7Z1_9ACTN|nr:VOC family protein [Streptomyces endophyticus]MEB8340136.1 VOC family protein [Streptomyces endophyticus]
MIRWAYAFLDRPDAALDTARTFWARATGAKASELRGERRQFATLLPEAGDACVKVQGVADGPGGTHLDLLVDDVTATGERARRLGASPLHAEPGLEVLRSPAGHRFCVDTWRGEHTVPPPTEPSNRLDQVCLDTAPDAYDAEVDFWSALTQWPEVPCRSPEFRLLKAAPIQLLLQRLDTDDPPSAHVDLACADADAVRARHERLGASHVSDGRLWIVMRDPVGTVYCLTRRDP